jgi:hypothetical protein
VDLPSRLDRPRCQRPGSHAVGASSTAGFAAIACGRTHGCRSELHRDTPVLRLGPGWFSAPLSRARSPQHFTAVSRR